MSDRPPPRRTPWFRRQLFRLGFPILVVFIGLGLLADRGLDFMRWTESKSWPVVEGTIESIAKGKSPRGSRKPSAGKAGQVPNFAVLTYSYTLEGATHRSTKVTYSTSGESIPAEWASEFPKDKPVKVHYDPGNHARAIIKVGEHFEYWNIRIAIAGFLLLMGGIRVFFVWRDG